MYVFHLMAPVAAFTATALPLAVLWGSGRSPKAVPASAVEATPVYTTPLDTAGEVVMMAKGSTGSSLRLPEQIAVASL